MNENLKKIQQRAVQYWFIDGLAEIGAGLVSLLLAILFLNWQVIFRSRWSLAVVLFVGLAVSFGLRLIIQRIKEGSTYLQTGFAAPFTGLENKRSVAIAVAFTILFLGFNLYLTLHGSQSMRWSSGLAGLVFAFIFAWTGYLTALRRFYYLALFGLVVGAVLAFLGVGYAIGVGFLTGSIGLVLIFFGIRTRKAYLGQNPTIAK